MNNDPEAVNQLLAWLYQDPDPTVSAPSGESPSQRTGPDESGVADLQFDNLDPLDSEEIGNMLTPFNESNRFSFERSNSFQLGDIPAVKDRFHALLKRRLRAEIERKPPLFPWETEVYDYESESSDWLTPRLVPPMLWAVQLSNLNLPIPMPETVLSRLFDQCQEVVQSSLQEGAKLVRAVEALFPGQSPALNQLAGLVLASPVRSGTLAPPQRSDRPAAAGFPSHFETATPAQQMALSLIAAREILDSLTLAVSPRQSKTERHWQTASGPLTLTAEYPGPKGQLRIQGHLPCSGSFKIQGGDVEAIAQRSSPGSLSVELFDLELNKVYPLEVQLTNSEQPPLIFAVHPASELEQ